MTGLNYSDALNSYSIILLFQVKHCSVRKEIVFWLSFSRGRTILGFLHPGVKTPGYQYGAPKGAEQLFLDLKCRTPGANVFDYSKISILTIFHSGSVHCNLLSFRPEWQVNVGGCVGRNCQVHRE